MTRPAAYRPREAARELSISPATLYRRMADGSIATVRFGGARLIPSAEIERIADVRAASAACPSV